MKSLRKNSGLVTTLLILCIIPFLPNLSYAQLPEPCGTMPYLYQLEQSVPGYADSILLNEQRVQQWIKNNAGLKTGSANTVIIPVVVHVVYNPTHPEQNIPDWQIKSQIDVLNEDYRRTNADATSTPDDFKSIAADCNIEFCLAQRTPGNLPTNGIVRTGTSVNVFSDFNSVKSVETGGDNPWPTGRYLNIWVCNMKGPQIGFGTFPGGDASLDGIVLHYAVFGRYNNSTTGYNLGRTCTHEVGHWLNLHHPWGDNQSGCYDSDYVNDTPNQDSADYGCTPYPQRKSCFNTGDMVMNYMNYAYDNCSNLFTAGQKTRMWAALYTSRATILSSDACNPVINYPLDIGISHIYFSEANTVKDSISPVVTLANFGNETVTTVDIHFQFINTSKPHFIFPWRGDLPAGQSIDVTLPQIRLINLLNVFIAYTKNPNGRRDMDTANDFSSSRSVMVAGVPTEVINQSFLAYPNPTNGSLTLQFNSPAWATATLQIFNLFGQEENIRSTIQPSNKIILEMAQLPAGVYIMKLNYKGKNYIQKVMRLPAN